MKRSNCQALRYFQCAMCIVGVCSHDVDKLRGLFRNPFRFFFLFAASSSNRRRKAAFLDAL
ncbi:hypothetical protein Scep_022433 [Stephania cephalantha]|uniref:Uncharacterized protein n=1 Tax=Stephania cephalantha TaxID=152367 RepID=A0AAP0F656_9MAGN